jgi:hypothetical protein
MRHPRMTFAGLLVAQLSYAANNPTWVADKEGR